jgi:hypothetical protein
MKKQSDLMGGIAGLNKTSDITKELMMASAMATHMEYGKVNTFFKKQVQANLMNTIDKYMEQTPVNQLIVANSYRQMGLTTPNPLPDFVKRITGEEEYQLTPFKQTTSSIKISEGRMSYSDMVAHSKPSI